MAFRVVFLLGGRGIRPNRLFASIDCSSAVFFKCFSLRRGAWLFALFQSQGIMVGQFVLSMLFV